MNKAALDELVRRYWEAETTPEEERRLAFWLLEPEAADARYDEVRAVMGLLATGRRLHRAKRKRTTWQRTGRKWAVAAMVGGLIFAGTRFIPLVEEQDVCVAYVGGERITDPTRVMNEAHNALQATQKPVDEANVEHALNDMFATINEP